MTDNCEFRFLKACRGEKVDATPVWFMRQAGRYMKAYRDMKEKYSFLEMCRTPELATEVTLQPVKASRPNGLCGSVLAPSRIASAFARVWKYWPAC